jgi:hypothetical protein
VWPGKVPLLPSPQHGLRVFYSCDPSAHHGDDEPLFPSPHSYPTDIGGLAEKGPARVGLDAAPRIAQVMRIPLGLVRLGIAAGVGEDQMTSKEALIDALVDSGADSLGMGRLRWGEGVLCTLRACEHAEGWTEHAAPLRAGRAFEESTIDLKAAELGVLPSYIRYACRLGMRLSTIHSIEGVKAFRHELGKPTVCPVPRLLQPVFRLRHSFAGAPLSWTCLDVRHGRALIKELGLCDDDYSTDRDVVNLLYSHRGQ